MKVKLMLRYIIQYCILLLLAVLVIGFTGGRHKVLNYIMFETVHISFQDFLSIIISILSIFIGVIITVTTVLISMCDKRVIKLINKYEKSAYLVSIIKLAIGSGLISLLLLGVVYSQLDFRVVCIRLIFIVFSGFFIYIFINRSMILVSLILYILKDSFTSSGDSLIVQPKFVNKNNEYEHTRNQKPRENP